MYSFRSRLVYLIMSLLLAPVGVAQNANVELNDRDTDWSGSPDNYEEPWRESASALPVVPSAENLTMLVSDRFEDEYEYVIDRNSVSLQADQVFRYTVIIRTPTGISNGFYEGIHCETRQFKTYGILTQSGFLQTTNITWQPIPRTGLTIHRAVLLDEFVCTGHSRPADLETINARLDESEKTGNRKIKVRRRDPNTEDQS